MENNKKKVEIPGLTAATHLGERGLPQEHITVIG